MLNKPAWQVPISAGFAPTGTDPQAAASLQGGLNLADLVGLVRRQWSVIAGCLVLVLLGAVAYLFVAQASFTATALMMIDTRKVQVFQQQQQVVGDATIDAATVESQVEVLKSENIAQAVIKELKLLDDPEFNGTAKGVVGHLVGSVMEFILPPAPPSDYERLRGAVDRLQKNLIVRRLGLTYVIEVSFVSSSPQKAAQIANAVAEAYVLDQLEAKYQATRRASVWLQDRIRELKEQAQIAERAVQDYKAQNNIVDTGGSRLLNEQQMAEMSSQLMLARATTAEAKARLDRISEINRDANTVTDATVTDVLKNEVITRLRQQYLDASKREADWSMRYGKNHNAAANLRNEMRETQRVISDELRRIAETYRSDFEIAKVREESLQTSLDGAIKQSSNTNQDRIALRDLESSAQTYRTLYDNFLQRFMEATQQQSFPITEARLITAASAPLRKSHPRGLVVLGLGGMLGLLLGAAAALGREHLDRVFRLPSQVERIAGVECLGVLPAVPEGKAASAASPADVAARRLSTEAGSHRHVVSEPFSRFTETMRGIKVAADVANLTRQNKVVGVVSALPNEGKTTVSANFASLVAHAGNRVLLIDSDLRNPSLTRSLAPKAQAGVLEVLAGRARLEDVTWTDPVTGLDFVPAVLAAPIAHTSELVSSERMAALLEAARQSYDYVVLDLPPVAPVVDVKAASHLIDSFVLVIEWGQTSHEAVVECLNSAPSVGEKLLGAVLNKADPSVLKRLEAYKGRYYRNYYTHSVYGKAA